jgi:hypothetical protein
MWHFIRLTLCLCLSLVLGSVLVSCEKPKEAKLVVSESKFMIDQVSKFSYSINAKGKIKNIGKSDVKNVLVTGYCKSCFNGLKPGLWTIAERERTQEEVAVINYIPSGGEAEFSFIDVAVMYNTVPEKPKEMPKNLEVGIVSFEIVD